MTQTEVYGTFPQAKAYGTRTETEVYVTIVNLCWLRQPCPEPVEGLETATRKHFPRFDTIRQAGSLRVTRKSTD